MISDPSGDGAETLRPPAGKTVSFFLSMTSKEGVMSGGWRGGGCGGGGGSGRCSAERPKSPWRQPMTFGKPAGRSAAAGVEITARIFRSQVSRPPRRSPTLHPRPLIDCGPGDNDRTSVPLLLSSFVSSCRSSTPVSSSFFRFLLRSHGG